jgi:hypothetical protein
MEKTMLKKVLWGVLFVGLIGILVTGAVVRTMAKTEHGAEAQALGHGYGHNETGESGLGYGWDGSQGRAVAVGGSGQGRGGYGGQGREDASRDGTGTGQAQAEEWLTLQGTVVSVDADVLIVETTGGEQIAVENRAWWFAQEQGFSVQIGDQVTLVGFYEGSDLSTSSGQRFEVSRIDNVTSGQSVLVRDENGRPLWAGGGRGGQGRRGA